MDAEPAPPPSPRRNAPWLVRSALSWSKLLAALAAVRILAATGEWISATTLAPGLIGIGNLAAVGAALAAVGLLAAIVRWRDSRGWRRVVLGGLLAVHLLTFAVCPPKWLLSHLQGEDVLFFVTTDQPAFALTIDDGLDPTATPLILEVLARHEAKATFFVLGETLEEHPELALRCLREGHELANHQMTDSPAVSLDPNELEREMLNADALLRDITTPSWFRPGGGGVTDRVKLVAEQINCRVALGSVFPFDSHIASARFSAAYLVGRAGPGEIVVLHDGAGRGERTAAALDAALPKLAARGLRAATLSELASF